METEHIRVRPPLKWAGGKFAIVSRIRRELPAGRALIEPFVGSAVVSLNVDYPRYKLSDVNADLVAFYQCLKTGGDPFIERCRALFTLEGNTPAQYYARRDRFNASEDPEERATLLLYLNRHGYNGLYRVNKKGIYNVPHGRYRRPKFPEQAMLGFRAQAAVIDLATMPFHEAMDRAEPGEVVYCDPPYVPLSDTADFVGYAVGGFGGSDQQRLAHKARELAERGITVVISNHDTPAVRELYAGARLVHFQVQRTISRDGGNRGKAPELLAIFGD